jgi:hypothetical protein
VADLLIRKISETTKELLWRRAQRRGKSLEADLRDTLERLAHAEAENADGAEPFGSWLVGITRPGLDLDDTLAVLRSAPVRPEAC